MTELTGVVERHGGRVFADEIHGPLVYPGTRHIPYASTSELAAAHTLTATSASKGWNLPGLKCAQVILSNEPDRQRWEEMGFFAAHGASNPGVVANIAAYRHGEAWLDEIVGYLDENRRLLAGLLGRHLPGVRYRPPDGTYLAWLDCTAMDLPGSPGELVNEPRAAHGGGRARLRRGRRGFLPLQLRHAAAHPHRDGRAHRRRPNSQRDGLQLSRRLARLGQGGGHHVRGLARRGEGLHRLHDPEVGILPGARREPPVLALHDQDPG